MAGKGGGAWKVAYADFVTAMMAFFLVMWITSQSDKIKQAIAHHFNDPFAPAAVDPEDDDSLHRKPPKHAAPARADEVEERKEAGGGGRTLLLTNQCGERTSIGTVIAFAEDSAELDVGGRRQLEEFVPYLLGKPQRVEIRGHSTRRPLPSGCPFRDHWQLTYTRCLAVMAELEKLGVERERMRLSQAAGNEPRAAMAGVVSTGAQSRVEIMLLNETAAPKAGEQQSLKARPINLQRPAHAAIQEEQTFGSPAAEHRPPADPASASPADPAAASVPHDH
jgi:chemotaxis protein MotB